MCVCVYMYVFVHKQTFDVGFLYATVEVRLSVCVS
jgi:hypothetical protein